MDAAARRDLLRIARDTLRSPPGAAPRGQGPETRFGGVFVSLHRVRAGQRDLRGCMGLIEVDKSLGAVVASATEAAAGRDPRFPPVGPDEVDALEIEISVMSPVESAPAERVVPGIHGVCISRDGRRAILLPQVAVEHGWDRDTFLGQVCLKAGLAEEAWRDAATRIEIFTAEVFHEDPAGAPIDAPA